MDQIILLDEINNEEGNEILKQDRENTTINSNTRKTQGKTEKEDDQIYFFDKNPNLENSMEDSFQIHSLSKLNESVEDIYRNNNKFSHVNPMRFRKSIYAKEKKPEQKRHTREVAIKELITNLKTQYIIFNIRSFIRNYQIRTNKNIDEKLYKTSLNIRNMTLYIYGIVMFFEKPWFCYKGTTIPLPSSFKFIENCDEYVVFTGIPFIYNEVLRIIEIIFTIIIGVTQILKYKVEVSLKDTNTGVNRSYNIIQVILFFSLTLCLADSIFSLIVKKFPIINFLCRPFIYIYMIRRLRINWTSILKVLWKTKKAYFVLFINLITFSLVGFILFSKPNGFFETFGESVLQIYILLTTCNFPDIMLEAMEYTKFAVIYFIICLSINYFILLSYLNNLYTTKYYKVNKRDCLDIIIDVIDNPNNKYIFLDKKFTRFLLKQKYLYHLNDDEYNNILVLFNLFNRNSDLYYKLVKISELTPEVEMISNTKYGRLILDSVIPEIIINIIYILCTISIIIFPDINLYFMIFHSVTSLLIIYEPILIIKNIGFKRLIKKHFNRTLFHLFNIGVITTLIIIYFLYPNNDELSRHEFYFRLLKLFISLRTIRILVFLGKFRIIKNIYIIIRISKEMINRNLLTLYSFIVIFSTLSILLTGGNIKKNSFEGEEIPNNYEYINFNDFASSYISCFCLLMINNLNILVRSLTYQSSYKLFYEFYFATFYFFSTLILINIIQTLILEMYLISDHSLSDKEKKDDEKEKEKKIEKFINEEIRIEEEDNRFEDDYTDDDLTNDNIKLN